MLIIKIKNKIKNLLIKHSPLLVLARPIYRLFRPDLFWKEHEDEKFRKYCYKKFENGEKILSKSYGKIKVFYEAISPKNYWHLAIGSQHEDRFMDWIFENLIRAGDIVLDIGAHTGMWSIPLAKIVGDSGHVYAFEPEDLGYNAIRRNTKINLLNNITVINMAVTDKEGTTSFYIRPDKDTHSVFEKTTAPSPLGVQRKIIINTSSVDKMIENGIIKQPDFVKIDVEGAELMVLNGMKIAARKIRHVLVELHEPTLLKLLGIKNPKSTVERNLKDLGFTTLKYLDDIHVLASKWK